uniref:Uncharacterized protein n=1 Tax=Rhizophora mucronata TaxID=61149 RepID=A0A2P2QR18_RHIMU
MYLTHPHTHIFSVSLSLSTRQTRAGGCTNSSPVQSQSEPRYSISSLSQPRSDPPGSLRPESTPSLPPLSSHRRFPEWPSLRGS